MKKNLIVFSVLGILAISIVSAGFFTGNAVWDWNWCSATNKCPSGEGDCDGNSQCITGYCKQNVGANYGKHRSMDVCECLKGTVWDQSSNSCMKPNIEKVSITETIHPADTDKDGKIKSIEYTSYCGPTVIENSYTKFECFSAANIRRNAIDGEYLWDSSVGNWVPKGKSIYQDVLEMFNSCETAGSNKEDLSCSDVCIAQANKKCVFGQMFATGKLLDKTIIPCDNKLTSGLKDQGFQLNCLCC